LIRWSASRALIALVLSFAGCSDAANTSADAAVSGAGSGVSGAGASGTNAVPAAGAPAAGTSASAGAGAGGTAGGAPAVCKIPDDLPVESEDGDDAGVAPDCKNVPKTIIASNCIGGSCHHTPNRFSPAAAMLDLMAPCVADRLAGVPSSTCKGIPRIDVQNVENSFLLNKLEAEIPICGVPMPLDSHLTSEQHRCMRAWINAVVRAWRRQ
jgi:hypothetical protein